MLKFTNLNLFIPRNFHSLIICLCLIKKKDENILLLNEKYFIKQHIKIIEKVVSALNCKTIIVEYYTNPTEKNFIKNYFITKKNFNKINMNTIYNKVNFFDKNINIFTTGDYFENIFFENIKNSKLNFYFIEHGIGNIMIFYQSYINFSKKNYYYFKNLIFFLLKKYLMVSLEIIPYKNYFGIYLKKKIIINNLVISSLIVNNYKFFFTKLKLLFISQFIKKKNYLSVNKNSIFINVPIFFNKNDKVKFINFLKKKLKKNDIIFIKQQNSNRDDKLFISFLKMLKFNKIKFILIKNKSLVNSPFEFFIKFLKVSRIFSSISSLSFNASLIFKNIKNYMFLTENILPQYEHFQELKPVNFNLYKKNFTNINYIEFRNFDC